MKFTENDPSSIWNRLLDRAAADGVDALSAEERRIVYVNRFLVDFESGGLSGFLYNISPFNNGRWVDLVDTIAAITSFGREEIAMRLQDVLAIVEQNGPDGSTWSEFINARDPTARLETVERELESVAEILWDDIADAALAMAS